MKQTKSRKTISNSFLFFILMAFLSTFAMLGCGGGSSITNPPLDNDINEAADEPSDPPDATYPGDFVDDTDSTDGGPQVEIDPEDSQQDPTPPPDSNEEEKLDVPIRPGTSGLGWVFDEA